MPKKQKSDRTIRREVTDRLIKRGLGDKLHEEAEKAVEEAKEVKRGRPPAKKKADEQTS